MSAKENCRWEERTWPELKRLATEVPEAGIHFQSQCAYMGNPTLSDGNRGPSVPTEEG